MKLRSAALVVALAATACSHGLVDPFDDDDVASNYDAYADGGGHWLVANGTLQGYGPSIQAVLIRRHVSFADGWVEAQSTRADDGGLVLRFRSPKDYYVLAFRDDSAPPPRDELNLAIYHHVNEEYDEMWRGGVDWRRGTRHTLRFEAAGDSLRAYFDGELQGTVLEAYANNDPVPSTAAGGVGLRQYGADPTWISTFDSFRWHGAR